MKKWKWRIQRSWQRWHVAGWGILGGVASWLCVWEYCFRATLRLLWGKSPGALCRVLNPDLQDLWCHFWSHFSFSNFLLLPLFSVGIMQFNCTFIYVFMLIQTEESIIHWTIPLLPLFLQNLEDPALQGGQEVQDGLFRQQDQSLQSGPKMSHISDKDVKYQNVVRSAWIIVVSISHSH